METHALNIGNYLETALPTEDIDKSSKFYEKLGYKIESIQPWGMAVLSKNDSRITLLSNKFHKKASLGYTVNSLNELIKDLKNENIQITSDDSKEVPARISINDPSGNEITIYQISK